MNKLPIDLVENMIPELSEELQINNDFKTDAPILVVTGPNAAGKSLFRKYVQMLIKNDYDEINECIHLSQQGRATAGFQRAFIYGSEDDESTGAISCHTFETAISTSLGREKGHILIWDEPEIGMGEELQMGAARWLRNKLEENWPTHLQGVILMSHSRLFIKEIMQFPEAKFMHIGGDDMTLEQWLNREILPQCPEETVKLGYSRRSKIYKILSKKSKEK